MKNQHIIINYKLVLMVLAPLFYYNNENEKLSSRKEETSGTMLLMNRGTFRDTPTKKFLNNHNFLSLTNKSWWKSRIF